MSKEKLKTIFREMKKSDVWALELIKINNSRRNGTSYFAREITLQPAGKMRELISELADFYLSDKGIDGFVSVDDYTGDVVGKVIYRLPTVNPLIHDEWEQLKTTLANPDIEERIELTKYGGYIITGTMQLAEGETQVHMVSLGAPASVMKNKFSLIPSSYNFKEIKEPVFTFRHTLDALIIDGTAYFFTLQAENLFNMERTHRKVCENKVEQVIQSLEMTNIDAFRKIATSGVYPRQFVSFNESKLYALGDKSKRAEYAATFRFKITEDNIIDTDDEMSVVRLLKFLCNKAAIDPVENSPKEVSAMKGWQ